MICWSVWIGKNPIAMSWIYTQQPIQILDAVYGLSHAKNKDDFRKSVQLVAAPGLNVMYGDAKGNVALVGNRNII